MPKTLNTTKHFQLAQQLRKQIQRMKVGDPLPTVIDLQKTYNVSQATVDRALDRLRREGLINRQAGHQRLVVVEGFDPATRRIAMIRPDYPSPTFEELTRLVVASGKKRDWAFEVVSYRKLAGLNLKRALGDNDAAVLLPTTEEFPESLLAALKRPRSPVIIIQDPPPGLRVSSVRIDDVAIGRLAVQHLASLGHTRIALFLSEPMAPSGRGRAEGWRQQMLAMGQTDLQPLIIDTRLQAFENSLKGSYNYFRNWFAAPHAPFTAVFCAAWTGAMSALRVLREARVRVPEDVSIIGHGGEGDIGPFLSPPLTAIETDLTAYGEAVSNVIEASLQGKATEPQHVTVPSVLVVRGSTARPASPPIHP